MKIHKDKIVFREPHLQTEEGRMSQTENPRWQALKKDIEKKWNYKSSYMYKGWR